VKVQTTPLSPGWFQQLHMQRLNSVMRKIHIYSAIPVILLMLFFSVTGILLNHPEFEIGEVEENAKEVALPEWAITLPDWSEQYASHSLLLLQWLDTTHQVRGVDFAIEWDELDNVLILDLAGPNGNTLVEVFVEDALVLIDSRKLSTVAMLNNLHRGKHVTGLWRAVSDVSAVCMVLFCISGLWLVVINRLERVPANIALVVGSGMAIFAIFLMH